MLSICGAREDSSESLGQQGNQTSPKGKQPWNSHWKDQCWSWSSSALGTWCKEPAHWRRPWCWERLKVGGEGAIEDEMVDGITVSMDMSLSKLQEIEKLREAWHAAIQGVTRSRTRFSDWTATLILVAKDTGDICWSLPGHLVGVIGTSWYHPFHLQSGL